MIGLSTMSTMLTRGWAGGTVRAPRILNQRSRELHSGSEDPLTESGSPRPPGPSREERMRKGELIVLTFVSLAAVTAPAAAGSTCQPDGTQASGAQYRICMPDAGHWN